MALTLHMHPLASFCMKALIAFYENETPFNQRLVDFGDVVSREAFFKLWPIGKMPVLRDDAMDRTVAEATIIIEHLALHYPGRTALVLADPDLALQTRFWDRFYDHYVHEPMQKIVTDKIRPSGQNDPYGVEQAKESLQTAYGVIDREMANKYWAMGDRFTMADCAAAPALFYSNLVLRIGDAHKNVIAYLNRLMERPSFARVVKEAQPYFHLFPG